MSLSLVTLNCKPGLSKHRGLLSAGNRFFQCALGRSGVSVFKREGDGATPANVAMRPLFGYFRADRTSPPAGLISFAPIMPSDGWCDDPAHPSYNYPVELPFAASHETMMRDDGLYDICVVLDFNMPPNARKKGAGSAIFLHCAAPGYRPTEGCIALAPGDLRWLLQHIDIETRFVVKAA